MQDTLKIGAAALGGYVLGRTKKAKTAISLALWLSGHGRPRDVARTQAVRLLQSDRGQELISQLRGPLMSVGKDAALALFERQAGRLSENLQHRTDMIGESLDETTRQVRGGVDTATRTGTDTATRLTRRRHSDEADADEPAEDELGADEYEPSEEDEYEDEFEAEEEGEPEDEGEEAEEADEYEDVEDDYADEAEEPSEDEEYEEDEPAPRARRSTSSRRSAPPVRRTGRAARGRSRQAVSA